MVKNFTRQLKKGRSLWWIAAFSVTAFVLCAGLTVALKFFLPAQPTALPAVPIYIYATPSLAPPNIGLPIGAPSQIPASPTPSPTVTSSAFSNWIFSLWTQNTAIPYAPQPAPIQAVVVTLTPTAVPFPSPPPQPSPNPNTCKNILYPARPASQWTYYVNTPKRSGNVNMRVIAVEGSQAAVDAVELNSGATARTYVQCDQDIILNFPLLSGQKVFGDMVNGEMNVDYIGGVLAPNEAAFAASNWALSWIIQYRIYGSGKINYNGRDFSFDVAPSNVQMTCQTLAAGSAAFETVTVSAGTFNALKVICRGEGQVSATVNGSQATGSITAQATQWFAPNIGLLKSQSNYANLDVFGISIPLNPSDVSGYIELKSYAIGQ
ncbi:MAG: hypothetical protein PHQ36_01150 [Anaerolineales bacterium]|nr:hypothetical protein [Anaerolineales bacterium]